MSSKFKFKTTFKDWEVKMSLWECNFHTCSEFWEKLQELTFKIYLFLNLPSSLDKLNVHIKLKMFLICSCLKCSVKGVHTTFVSYSDFLQLSVIWNLQKDDSSLSKSLRLDENEIRREFHEPDFNVEPIRSWIPVTVGGLNRCHTLKLGSYSF